MSYIISYYIVVLVMGIYYIYKKREDKRFGASPLNKKIEAVYKKWYRKNGFLLNRETTTIPEINKILYELKISLTENGMEKKYVKSYLETLKNENLTSRIGIKDMLVAVLGWFTTNSFIQKCSNELYLEIKEVLKNNENFETLINILYVILMLGGLITLLLITYFVLTLENVRRDNQRFFVFEELEKIWDLEVDTNVIDDNMPLKNDKIYKKLKYSESNFDKMLKYSSGDSIVPNINLLIGYFSSIKNGLIKIFMSIYLFLLGFIPSGLLFILLICMYKLTVEILMNFNSINIYIYILISIMMVVLTVLVFLVWLICYNSQIGVFCKNDTNDNVVSKKYYKRKQSLLSYIQIIIHFLIILGTGCFVKNEGLINFTASIAFVIFMLISLTIGAMFSLRNDN